MWPEPAPSEAAPAQSVVVPVVARVVARREIAVGERVTADDVELRDLPRLGDWDEPGALAAVVGRVATGRLLAGEPVLQARLADGEFGPTLGATLERGQRGVWVEVDAVGGIAPQDYVDLVRTFDGPEPRTRTVVQAVPVLRVDVERRGLVVAVWPAQAQSLGGAWPTSVVARSPVDVLHIEVNGPAGPHGPPQVVVPDGAPVVGMASRQLFPGVPIDEDDLVAVPATAYPEGLPLAELVGRVPREWVAEYEVVRAERLAVPARDATLVPRGMRTLSVPIAPGWIEPGDYVDVLVAEGGQVHMLLQATFVFAVDVTGDEVRARLLVTSDEAELLAHALHTAAPVRLALRNDLDVNFVELAPLPVSGP